MKKNILNVKRRKGIALALGGGGARALCHIGVFNALEEEKIPISIIAGTSMGGFIGAIYSLYPNSQRLKNIIFSLFAKNKSVLVNLASTTNSPSSVEGKKMFIQKSLAFVKKMYIWNYKMIKSYLVDPRPYQRIFWEAVGRKSFSDCQIPFLTLAVDLWSSKIIVFSEGSLFQAIVATSALPGVFPPLRYKNYLLTDGGALQPLPAPILKNYNKVIVGISVEEDFSLPKQLNNIIDILFTIDRIRYQKIIEDCKQAGDVIINPPVGKYKWFDFLAIERLIQIGYEETKKQIGLIKRKINKGFLNFRLK